ncbi:MAG: type IV secretion system protein [Rickettsiaceae bacterium]|nr:type IV secretion system protein [Rickettsiaceae bacterium]
MTSLILNFRFFCIIAWTCVLFTLSSCTEHGCISYNGESINTNVALVDSTILPSGYYASANKLDSGINVTSGQLFRTRIFSSGLYIQPAKYRVVVRLDPRFTKPLTLIAKYNYQTGEYESDWGNIGKYVTNPESTTPNYAYSKSLKYNLEAIINYDNYVSRNAIKVNAGDVVTLRQITQSDIESIETNINVGTGNENPVGLISSSNGIDNAFLLASDKDALCSIMGSTSTNCNSRETFMAYVYTGYAPDNIIDSISSIPECTNDSLLCKTSNGKNLIISIGGNEKKRSSDELINIQTSSGGKNIYYIYSDTTGNLEFDTDINMSGTISHPTNTDYDIWQLASGALSSYTGIDQNSDADPTLDDIGAFKTDIGTFTFNNFIGGRYIFEIEIGSGTGAEFQEKINDIKVDYIIENSTGEKVTGTIDGNLSEMNAPMSGRVYYNISYPYNDIGGNLGIQTQSYTANTSISRFFYDKLINPIKHQLRTASRDLFTSIKSNGDYYNLISAALTMCIVFAAIFTVIDPGNFKHQDLVYLVIKIVIVASVLTENSWTFFNEYFLSFFFDTTDYLMNTVSNNSSIVGNPLSFIDPILNNYFDATLWKIIFTYFINFFQGYIFVGIILFVGIFMFVWTIIEVVAGYLLAFIGVCTLISLGPIFIIFLLFERTRNIFDNWLNVMLGYILQPTLALIFVLLVDRMTSSVLENQLRDVCVDTLFSTHFFVPFLSIDVPGIDIKAYVPSPYSESFIDLMRTSIVLFAMITLVRNVVTLSTDMTDKLLQGAGSGGGASHGGQEMGSWMRHSSLPFLVEYGGSGLKNLRNVAGYSGYLGYKLAKLGIFTGMKGAKLGIHTGMLGAKLGYKASRPLISTGYKAGKNLAFAGYNTSKFTTKVAYKTGLGIVYIPARGALGAAHYLESFVTKNDDTFGSRYGKSISEMHDSLDKTVTQGANYLDQNITNIGAKIDKGITYGAKELDQVAQRSGRRIDSSIRRFETSLEQAGDAIGTRVKPITNFINRNYVYYTLGIESEGNTPKEKAEPGNKNKAKDEDE